MYLKIHKSTYISRERGKEGNRHNNCKMQQIIHTGWTQDLCLKLFPPKQTGMKAKDKMRSIHKERLHNLALQPYTHSHSSSTSWSPDFTENCPSSITQINFLDFHHAYIPLRIPRKTTFRG